MGLYPMGSPYRDSRGQLCPVGSSCGDAEGLCSLESPCRDSGVLCLVGSPCGDAGWGHPPKDPHAKMLGDNYALQDSCAGLLVGCALQEPMQGFWGRGEGAAHSTAPSPDPQEFPDEAKGPCGTSGVGARSGHSRALSLSRCCLVCGSCHQLQIPSTSNEQCHQ